MFCGSTRFRDVFEYVSPPEGETGFNFIQPSTYHRQIIACEVCGHFYSMHQMELLALYSGEYNNSTYQDVAGMHRTFEHIIALDPEKSDNTGRCNRIESFLRERDLKHTPASYRVLDVGSGLGVFPYAMAKRGYDVIALDPDPKAMEHIQDYLKIPTLCSDFFEATPSDRYNLITFNKVLEHVADPVAMLRRARSFLNSRGIVYIELPDGELAQNEGSGREEFFIDHLHVFSFVSTALLISCAGFSALEIERLQEPSTKFTLRAFLT
ncbi:MAG: class I SAM-dependent methyltransferase [Gammaproteobacteria bacterium]|nr:class I SAM-dependent methyltransferase [Gammaproteobacteria bacterium]